MKDALYPAFSPWGNRIAVIKRETRRFATITAIQVIEFGREIFFMAAPEGGEFIYPFWLSQDKLGVIVNNHGKNTILLIDLLSGTIMNLSQEIAALLQQAQETEQ